MGCSRLPPPDVVAWEPHPAIARRAGIRADLTRIELRHINVGVPWHGSIDQVPFGVEQIVRVLERVGCYAEPEQVRV
jgi:hypothetical protein